MTKIVECIPNFSEGRRKEVVDEITNAIKSVTGISVLDVELDASHNRSVITFIGEPENCKRAAFLAIKKASELIDLNVHKGEHPRIGATDVVPFVPISNVTMEECVQLANELAKEVWDKLRIPVYMYEEAATREERRDLAYIRKGEYEGLKEEIKTNPARAPDYGERELHPTAGATVIGARMPLIAYNVNLRTTDVSVAKKIAKSIRFRNGGFRYLKALGFEIKDKGYVQVSMNLTNYLGTPLYRAFDIVKHEAERYGVPVLGSEIVGLVPRDALLNSAIYYLCLHDFKKSQILENRLEGTESDKLVTLTLDNFLSRVADSTPAPGGGSCSALAGATASALCSMILRIMLTKKKFADLHENCRQKLNICEKLRVQFMDNIDRDTEAFNEVITAIKIPKEALDRDEKIEMAYIKAINVPLSTMKYCTEMAETVSFLLKNGPENLKSDILVAREFLNTAFLGAKYNVEINLSELKNEETRKKYVDEQTLLLQEYKIRMTSDE